MPDSLEALPVWVFLRLEPPPPPLGDAYVEFTRPGDDGHRYHYLGRRARPVSVRAELSSPSLAQAEAAIAVLHAGRGTLVKLQDWTLGRLFSVFVLDVQTSHPRPIVSTLAGDNVRVSVELQVQTVE